MGSMTPPPGKAFPFARGDILRDVSDAREQL
jgi:hypothetical protein